MDEYIGSGVERECFGGRCRVGWWWCRAMFRPRDPSLSLVNFWRRSRCTPASSFDSPPPTRSKSAEPASDQLTCSKPEAPQAATFKSHCHSQLTYSSPRLGGQVAEEINGIETNHYNCYWSRCSGVATLL
jgi:hypothetical protein